MRLPWRIAPGRTCVPAMSCSPILQSTPSGCGSQPVRVKAAEEAGGEAQTWLSTGCSARGDGGQGCLSEGRSHERRGPTFGCRRALSIRGLRTWFLRSIIGGALQGRLWNIHKEPFRAAASARQPPRPCAWNPGSIMDPWRALSLPPPTETELLCVSSWWAEKLLSLLSGHREADMPANPAAREQCPTHCCAE